MKKDTLPNLETILNAVNNLRQDISDLRSEMNERLLKVETDLSQVKELNFVFENEFDRLLALSHKALELSHENRADVRIMRKEISAWSHDVRALERKVV